jgi:hypothetical protein
MFSRFRPGAMIGQAVASFLLLQFAQTASPQPISQP